MSPRHAVAEWGVLLGGFSPEKFESPETQISLKKIKAHLYHLVKKKHSVTGWQGFTEHVYQFQGLISKKRRRHCWMLNKFGAIGLNQPV